MKQVIIYYHNKYRTTNNTTSSLLIILLIGTVSGTVCTIEQQPALAPQQHSNHNTHKYKTTNIQNNKHNNIIITNFIRFACAAPDLFLPVHESTGTGPAQEKNALHAPEIVLRLPCHLLIYSLFYL